jgi:hypothetical protein
MDISVSRLNNRLALQLPAELPLGLVFVVGRVESVVDASSDRTDDAGRFPLQLELGEADHRLRCMLTQRVAAEITIRPGDKVRAGGHLAFDPQHADYFLLVRDLELIEEAQVVLEEIDEPLPPEASSSLLEDLNQPTESVSLPHADMPDWVQKMAPPEMKAESASTEPTASQAPETQVEPVTRVEVDSGYEELASDGDDLARSEEDLLSTLSEAMDSGEDIELKPEMFAGLIEAREEVREAGVMGQPYEVPPTAAAQASQSIPQPQQADPLIVLLLITFVVVILTALVIVTVLLLR